jgi:xanthine dehydrogenase accessory factor
MDAPGASWIETLSELRAAGRACAMVVVTGVRGSGPREAGARMIVAGGDIAWGTIGGGNLERLAIEHCAELLAQGRTCSESVAYPLSEKVGQCCGGEVTLFYETFAWARRRLVVFGAGHVGQAVGGLAGYLPADVLLVDGRDEAAIRPALPPAGRRPYELLCIDEPAAEVERLPAGALVLVMTHSHALDLEIVAAAIRRPDLAYVGLIGSERKWRRFEQRLLARGFTPAEFGRVRCPIGVTKTSKDPSAIAISAAAELIDVLAAADAEPARGSDAAGGAARARKGA